MKQLKPVQCLLLSAVFALWASGCATPNVNPPQARANTGYVDFYADPADELYWQVERFDDRAQGFQKVVSQLEPAAGGCLRLAFAPGHHRLQVTFLNRVIVQPVACDVEVQDGKITPVRVSLTAARSTLVTTREISRGGTATGHYGRRNKYSSDETVSYRLSAVVEASVAYRLKEQMPYAR